MRGRAVAAIQTVEEMLIEDAQHELVQLRAEVAELEQALESRELIGRAVGIVMVTTACASEEAFQTLVRQSHKANRKVRDIARDVIACYDR